MAYRKAPVKKTPTYYDYNKQFDKSMFVKAVFDAGRRLLITAPKTFFKTGNLNFLKNYLSVTKLDGAKPIKYEKSILLLDHGWFFQRHISNHPVLALKFTAVYTPNYEGALNSYRSAIHRGYEEHGYLLTSDALREGEFELVQTWSQGQYESLNEDHVVNDLVHLVRMIKRHFNKNVILLIDEYDSVVNHSLTQRIDDDEFKNILNLTESILKKLLKGNNDVSIAVLTGVSCITTRALSDINNLRIYPFLEDHEFGSYFGVTADDLNGEHPGLSRYFTKRKYYVYNPYLAFPLIEHNRDAFYAETRVNIKKITKLLRDTELIIVLDNILRFEEFCIRFISKPLLQDVLDLKNSYYFDKRMSKQLNFDIIFSHLLELGVLSYKNTPADILRDDVHIDEREDEQRSLIETPDDQIYLQLMAEFQNSVLEICSLPEVYKNDDQYEFIHKLHCLGNSIWNHRYGTSFPQE